MLARDEDILKAAEEWKKAGRGVALATVVETWGSAPRPTGSNLVIDDQGKAQAQTVQTGDWIGSDWAIVAGLKTGDRVIVDNLLKIRPGAPVVEAPPAASSASATPTSGSAAPAAGNAGK